MKKRESRQNPRPTNDLGKFEWETVYHGDHAFFRWRSCQNRRPGLGNSQRKPFIMAILHEKAAFMPKPAGAWEKTMRKPFILAIAKPNAIELAKLCGSAKPSGLAKREGISLVVGAINDNKPQIRVSLELSVPDLIPDRLRFCSWVFPRETLNTVHHHPKNRCLRSRQPSGKVSDLQTPSRGHPEDERRVLPHSLWTSFPTRLQPRRPTDGASMLPWMGLERGIASASCRGGGSIIP